MSYLRNVLIDRYAHHYARVNESIDPALLDENTAKRLDYWYSDFIENMPPDSKILDLGCGTGLLLKWLTKKNGIVPVGVDSSLSQFEIARRSMPDVRIVLGDGLEFLRANSETFAGIFCRDVLEHIPGDDECLRWVEAAHAALQPGGFFYCRVPNAANLTGNYSRYMDLTHERAFTSTSLLQLLDAAGFTNVRIVPVRNIHLAGKSRLFVEHAVHRAVYRLCGRGLERVFTTNVCAIAYRGVVS